MPVPSTSSRPHRKVLCAMSGGVDSSVAAALLVEQGFEVVGCFMRLGSPGETLDELVPLERAASACKVGHQGCCSINDAQDARQVAAMLGIPFYVCNFKKDFGRIIDYFVDEYTQGRTPNPCVRCNDWLKFGKLREYARQIDAEFVASGHYARVEDGPAGPCLLRGLDDDKDQSYVLFGVARADLPHMLLPIGGMHKSAVREKARALGLPVFDKPDSQEICFVPDNDYAGLVERRRPDVARGGAILDTDGRTIGQHGGQHRFTLGQRRGIGVALGHPIYVVGKDAAANTITVGGSDRLLSAGCTVAEANWLADVQVGDRVLAKYRYNSKAVPGVVSAIDANGEPRTGANYSGRPGRFEIAFEEPQSAVTPGQALVLYEAATPARVLGGGWIESVTDAQAT